MTTIGMMNPRDLLGQPSNPLLGHPLYPQLQPRGVQYPDVPVYGQYGQQALDMAARPASAPRTGTPMPLLPALPPAPPQMGGSGGGGGGGSGLLGALLTAGRIGNLTGTNLSDIYNRFTGGGAATLSPGVASSAESGALSGIGGTEAANEAALLGQSAPTLAPIATGGLAAGAEAGALGGLAGTQAATEAALLGQAAPTLAPIATGGGSAAGGAAAAGTSAGGLAAGLGIAALPAAIFAMGGLANDRTARNQLALQQSGLEQTQLAGGTRVLMAPDGSFVPFNENLMNDIRERWGVLPTDQFWSWFNSQPRVQGNVRRLNGRQLPRGGNAASEY